MTVLFFMMQGLVNPATPCIMDFSTVMIVLGPHHDSTEIHDAGGSVSDHSGRPLDGRNVIFVVRSLMEEEA